MAPKPTQTVPTWRDVKGKLAEFDRVGLFGIIQDLYAASKSNQTFLHARFGLGGDVLAPYKAIIDRWLWPDPIKNQDTSVAAAKKAITDYRKAAGQPEGLGRVCKRLQPEQDHADVDHGEIVVATLLIPRSDAPGLLEAVDQPLDFVA